MKRFFKWLQGLFGFFMDSVEDPIIMIDQAKRDMQESLIKNRERAIQAITQKNKLDLLVSGCQNQIHQNEAQAGMALKQRNQYAVGSPEYIKFQQLALQFAKELSSNQAQLVQLQAAATQAGVACDQVKKAIERQEQVFRAKLGEAAALKAQYKSAQVQNAIAKALDECNFDNINEGFGAAAEKVQNMQAEASARNEMLNSSLSGRVAELEQYTADADAQTALAGLEQRLGLSTPPVAEVTQTVSVGGADEALKQLENRLGNS